MKIPRRHFLKTTAVAGAAASLPLTFWTRSAFAVANSANLSKWIQPLRGLGPTGIPVLSGTHDPVFPNTNLYQVTIGEYLDQLHPQLGPTRLWGYADTTNPVFRHLGGVIVTPRNRAARIRFTNVLPSRHILPVDITLAGANLAQNRTAVHLHGGLVPWISDGGPFDWWTPGCYDYAQGLSFLNGPGGVFDNCTGSPMVAGQADYYYPNNQSTRLVWYHDHAHGITRLNAYAGIASGYLIVDAAYDAAKIRPGMAPATGAPNFIPLVIQDKIFVNPTTPVTDPTWADVTRPDVQTNGSLWYDHTYNPKLFKLKKATAVAPTPDPSCIPEFFGDTILVNGTVYPLLSVEPKRYRFVMLNACNARFLNLSSFVANRANPDGIDLNTATMFPANPAGPAMIQIGNEGGYLLKEVMYATPAPFNPLDPLKGGMILAPAERSDFIMDFSAFAGRDIILYSDAPGPFPGGAPTNDYFLGNPTNPVQPLAGTGPDTRQILRIRVAASTTTPEPQPAGPILNTALLDPPTLATLPPLPAGNLTPATVLPPLTAPPGTVVRDLTLNEAFDRYGRLLQQVGTTAPQPAGGFGQDYLAPPTEVVNAGAMEVWRIYNTTADTHPMHFHLVNVQVLSRQSFRLVGGVPTPTKPASLRGPEPNELGWKETVKMNPGEVITVLMKFDLPAVPFTVPSSPRMDAIAASGARGSLALGKKYHEYVWHCHILEHEEHDMMRPLIVQQ